MPHPLLTCDNAACQKRAKEEGWLLHPVSIVIFLVSQLFNRISLPLTCHILPPPASMNYKTHAQSITQKTSRSINRSNGDFCTFLSSQLSSWNLPPLTCYLMQPSPSLNYKPHNPCHTLLWAQPNSNSNNNNNNKMSSTNSHSSVSIAIFTWSTIYVEMALPDLWYLLPPPPLHELQTYCPMLRLLMASI